MALHKKRMREKVVALALFAAALCSGTAGADEKGDCLAEHEQGQLARRAGQFQWARNYFAACQAQTCPTAVRERCADFARELESVQPSVVVVVSDESGVPVAGARLSTDDGDLAPIPALAIRLDPGNHALRVEAAGFAPIEKTISLAEGMKDVQLFVTLTKLASPFVLGSATSSDGDTVPKLSPPAGSRASGPNTVAWAFAIAGGVALVGAGALSATGWAMHGNLKESCGDTAAGCTSSQVEPLRIIWPASFVALGLGVASAAAATILFATHSKLVPARPSTAWVLVPDAAKLVFP